MALKEVYLTDDVSSSINAQGDRKGTRNYFAWFDPTDDEIYVRTHLGFGVYSHHPTDYGQMIEDLQVQCLGPSTYDDNSPAILWSVQAQFGKYQPTANESPLAMPPRIRVAGTRVSKLADVDRDGEPILNSVGDPYDPPLEKDSTSLTLYVMRNEEVGSISVAMMNVLRRSDKVNAAAFLGFDKGTLKTSTLTLPDREYDPVARKYYYPMEYGFEFKPEGWTTKVLNAGYFYKDQSGNRKQALVDGSPASVPILLSSTSEQLMPPVDKTTIVINDHELYEELDYTEFAMDDVLNQQLEPIPPPVDAGSGSFG